MSKSESDIRRLHDSLDCTFIDKKKDLKAAKESAYCIADRVEYQNLGSRFEQHEVRVYDMRRTFLVSLKTQRQHGVILLKVSGID